MSFQFINNLPYDLVVRLNELVPKTIWAKRMKGVNNEHEKMAPIWEVSRRCFSEKIPTAVPITPFFHSQATFTRNFMNRREPAKPTGMKLCWTYDYKARGNRVEPTLKEFQKYADENGIKYKKSWSKWQLASVIGDCPESWLRHPKSNVLLTNEPRFRDSAYKE